MIPEPAITPFITSSILDALLGMATTNMAKPQYTISSLVYPTNGKAGFGLAIWIPLYSLKIKTGRASITKIPGLAKADNL